MVKLINTLRQWDLERMTTGITDQNHPSTILMFQKEIEHQHRQEGTHQNGHLHHQNYMKVATMIEM